MYYISIGTAKIADDFHKGETQISLFMAYAF